MNVQSKKDGRNIKTAYTWDDNHNMTAVTRDADGIAATTAFQYDALTGKVSRITDPLNRITDMVYDTSGNLLERQAPIGISKYTYDDSGLLIRTEDPDGVVTVREYDGNGYLTRVVIPDTDPLIETVMTYDNRGNLLTRTDPNGNQTTYAYDALDRLTHVTNALSRQTQFEYDANGNLTRTIDPSGTYTDFTYDDKDRVSLYLHDLRRDRHPCDRA